MLSSELKFPHIETNEDGKQHQHPGYIEVKCSKCGKYFIVVKNSNVTLCGDSRCEELLKKD